MQPPPDLFIAVITTDNALSVLPNRNRNILGDSTQVINAPKSTSRANGGENCRPIVRKNCCQDKPDIGEGRNLLVETASEPQKL
ncbi:hypothetical protein [Synechococcus sp. M16CYN]|uniref:hypothetical protein n=1 Tax=Synechococcus sp. M16CYN TaxID=3103139 RepID=UPI00333F7BD6